MGGLVTPPPKKRGKIKGGTHEVPAKAVATRIPPCPIHSSEMVFKPGEGRWRCTVEGCKQAAFPPRLASGAGEPVVGGGQLELVIAPATTPESTQRGYTAFLRSVDDNLMLDVTPYLMEMTYEAESDTIDVGTGRKVQSPMTRVYKLEIHLFDGLDLRP